MNILLFDTFADATTACEWISTRLGYPRLADVQSGSGIHAEGVVIAAYCDVLERYDGAAWGLIADAVTTPLVAEMRAALPGLAIADPLQLPESWVPPFVP